MPKKPVARDYSKMGKVGMQKRWGPVETEKLKIIQQLYRHHDKKLVDWMTEGWSLDRLRRLLTAIEKINKK